MADSIILATARLQHATLWTQDSDSGAMDGVRYIEKDWGNSTPIPKSPGGWRETAGPSVACWLDGRSSHTYNANVWEVTIKTIKQPTLIFSEVSDRSTVYLGDAYEVLSNLPSRVCQTAVTSPPYWGLRDYEFAGQIGSEEKVEDYVDKLVLVFRELRRVLEDNGTFWLNLGDCYTSGGRTWRAPDKKNPARAMSYRPPTPEGLKPKDLVGVPWRVAMALQADGWYLRSEIIWHKPNPHPESVKDRPSRAHETIFLLSKSERYYYDYEAVRERGANGKLRNRRSVWTIQTEPINEAHFATFPTKLVEPCILAGSRTGDFVIDPFFGSGTTGLVAALYGRSFIGVELKPEYIEIAKKRLGEYGFTFDVTKIDQSGE